MPRNITVTFKDGTSHTYQNAPDDVTPEQIEARVSEQFGKPIEALDGGRTLDDAIAELPDSAPPLAVDVEGVIPKDEKPESFVEGMVQGVADPLFNLAKGAEWIADKAGIKEPLQRFGEFINPGASAPSVADARTSFDASLADGEYRPGDGGRLAGNIAATAPLAMLPGGALAQGGLGGALLSQAETPGGLLADTVTGAAGGKAGELIMRGIGGAVAPKLNEGLRTLINEGVRVTPGQFGRASGGKLGEFVARREDAATSVGFVGDAIRAGRNKSLDDFGRAAVNRAVGAIGLELPKDVPVGRKGVKWAGDQLSNAYNEVLPQIRATGDRQFADDLAAIHQEAATMAPDRVTQFNNILQSTGRFFQDGVNLDGAALKEIEERIGQKVRRLIVSPDADQQELGAALNEVLDATREMAARQNPELADQLRNINKGWKSLTQVELSSANSKAAISPAGYSQAVKRSSDTVRRRGYARGEALNQDLADAASDILPSEVADSGTAERWMSQNLLANALGAAQIPAYKAAEGVTKVLSRDPSERSKQIADLIRLGAPLAVAPGSLGATGTMHSLTN